MTWACSLKRCVGRNALFLLRVFYLKWYETVITDFSTFWPMNLKTSSCIKLAFSFTSLSYQDKHSVETFHCWLQAGIPLVIRVIIKLYDLCNWPTVYLNCQKINYIFCYIVINIEEGLQTHININLCETVLVGTRLRLNCCGNC